MKRALPFVMAALPLASLDCVKDSAQPEPAARFVPSPPTMPRLTSVQYRNTIKDVFGGALPQTALEPDQNPYLFYSIGAATTSLSEQGTQQYAESAGVIVEALFGAAKRREALLGCTPKSVSDDCVSGFVKRIGRRLFRRPLTEADLNRWLSVVATTAEGDVYRGLRLLVYGMLQSPRFLYRVEVGEDDPAQGEVPRYRYDSFEMAERLSFLLWNTTPDDELLSAAERGELLDEASLDTQARRLLASPRARTAVQGFFDQYFDLSSLSQVERDPALFPKFSKTLLSAMRTEVQLLVDDLVFRIEADIRGIFSTRRTFVNSELASLYQVEAQGSSEVAFVPVELPPSSARAGVLSLGAVLTMNAHPTDTSPTRRGKYLRERVLCMMVPPPPPGVSTELPPKMGGMPKTLRERLDQHRENPACYSCHAMMDPPGFLFEHFDPIGAFRTMTDGVPVNTKAEIEGEPMDDAQDLAARLAFDPRVASCIVKQVFRHASARLDGAGDEPVISALTERFGAAGFRFRDLLVELVKSEGFRTAAKEVTP